MNELIIVGAHVIRTEETNNLAALAKAIVDALELENPLLPYLHSSNHLGDIYRIPRNVQLSLNPGAILERYIHAEVTYTRQYMQVIVIHPGALNKQHNALES